ncbi:hypothetical protein DPMN_125100 [Dreissena polymorpha]|uniref:Uncharacterized protein n=1 Tax=Dreissena polymorpha TaxID=45954 RepID=A0A9D4GXK3_DREPO|nr:hypothetical protein DPMN_125100 [Dreissena polymorpha]
MAQLYLTFASPVCVFLVSKDWSHAGKSSPRLCSKCRIFFKKYGVDRPVNTSADDSPYFTPLRDGEINGSHNMLTRQNRNSVSMDCVRFTAIFHFV